MASIDISSIQVKLRDGQVELSKEEYESLFQMLTKGGCNNVLPQLSSSSEGLVRCRAMVQDMMDPEYYFQGVPANEVDPMDLAGKLGERQPLLLVPLPFASEWTLEDGSIHVDNETPAASKKRLRDESMETEQEIVSKKQISRSPTAVHYLSRESRGGKMTKQWSWPPGCMGANPNETPVVCHFYYDIHKGPKLRLNDVVEVIGMLDPVPMSNQVDESDDRSFFNEDAFFEEEEDDPTKSLPRLHAVCYRKIDLDDLIDEAEPMETDEIFKSVFSAALGSQTAAEALFVTLFSQAEREISRNTDEVAVPVKTPYDTTLGCASLNLILPNVQSCNTAATYFQTVLQQIFPVVGRIDMNEKGIMSPVKVGARLVPSPFQLPKGAIVIVVDNRLDDKAVSAETLEALQSMTKDHSVPYRFDGGIRFNFEADYRIIVLSPVNRACMLPCTLTMKLREPVSISNRPELSESDAVQLRCQLAKGCQTNVVLETEVLTLAQQDFVDRRQHARDLETRLDGEEDFHRWLTLTRLYARSDGRDVATIVDWKNALRLDDAMRKS